MTPKVSVIVPSYGTPDRLERTVNSVLRQTLSDLELIVVDDNDPDSQARKETRALMEGFTGSDPRVRYLCHERNKNGSAARNTGIRAAQGKYLAFLDSDDEYVETRLERCAEALENARDPKIQAVYTGCELRKNDQKYRVLQNVRSGNFMTEYLQLRFNLFTGSNIFVTKSAADSIGGFDETFTRHQDVEFMIRIFTKYDIVGLPDVLVVKNIVGANDPSPEKFEKIKLQFFEKFRDLIATLPKREQDRVYGYHYAQLAENCLRARKYVKALRFYNQVRKYHCLDWRRAVRFGVYLLRSFK